MKNSKEKIMKEYWDMVYSYVDPFRKKRDKSIEEYEVYCDKEHHQAIAGFFREAIDRTREDAVKETIETMKGFYVGRNSNGWNEQLDTMINKLKETNEKD